MAGIKLLKFVKTPLNVALRKMDVSICLLLHVILTSKKKKESFFSNFKVNLMFGCLVFMQLTKSFKCDWERDITKLLLTYHLKTLRKISGGSHSQKTLGFSKWHKNAISKIGASEETPSICLYMTWSKIKNDSRC